MATIHEIGSCDVLVNNAAFTGTSGVPGYAVPFDEQTDEAFAMALTLNLTAPFSLTRRLAPSCGPMGTAASSTSRASTARRTQLGTLRGDAHGNPAAYAASKGGLAQLTRYLAMSSPRDPGQLRAQACLSQDEAFVFLLPLPPLPCDVALRLERHPYPTAVSNSRRRPWTIRRFQYSSRHRTVQSGGQVCSNPRAKLSLCSREGGCPHENRSEGAAGGRSVSIEPGPRPPDDLSHHQPA